MKENKKIKELFYSDGFLTSDDLVEKLNEVIKKVNKLSTQKRKEEVFVGGNPINDIKNCGLVKKEEPTQEQFTKRELKDIQDIYTREAERFSREFGMKSKSYLFVKNLLSKIERLLK